MVNTYVHHTSIGLIFAEMEVTLEAGVLYEFYPEQKQIINPVDMSQEGIPASVSIYAVYVEPTTDSEAIDIMYLLTPEMLESMDEDILAHLKAQHDGRPN